VSLKERSESLQKQNKTEPQKNNRKKTEGKGLFSAEGKMSEVSKDVFSN